MLQDAASLFLELLNISIQRSTVASHSQIHLTPKSGKFRRSSARCYCAFSLVARLLIALTEIL